MRLSKSSSDMDSYSIGPPSLPVCSTRFAKPISFEITPGLNNSDATSLGLVDAAGGGVISTAATAQSALSRIDESCIALLSSRRGKIGALQNRLEYTISNLNNTAENFQAANSRIEDADFALESASYVRNQILTQAGVSVLAQANTLPQQALNLLG